MIKRTVVRRVRRSRPAAEVPVVIQRTVTESVVEPEGEIIEVVESAPTVRRVVRRRATLPQETIIIREEDL